VLFSHVPLHGRRPPDREAAAVSRHLRAGSPEERQASDAIVHCCVKRHKARGGMRGGMRGEAERGRERGTEGEVGVREGLT
jgi:hypothetical protein